MCTHSSSWLAGPSEVSAAAIDDEAAVEAGLAPAWHRVAVARRACARAARRAGRRAPAGRAGRRREMSVDAASGTVQHHSGGYARAASNRRSRASCACIDCAAHESPLRGALLPPLLGGLGLVALALPGERRGARHRRQGRPADPRVAVQLDGGDRARRLVRRALDAVDAPAAAAASSRARLFATAGCARGMACEPASAWRCSRSSLQRLRRRAGEAGELLGDVHLRDLLGRHPGRERARSATSSARSTRGGRARALVAAAGAAISRRGRPRRPPLRYPRVAGHVARGRR